MDFLVDRSDLHRCRFDDVEAPEPGPGQALLAVDAFGLSANNITYAMFGEAMSYWNFFPAEDGWGRVPVWGFADVAHSRHEQVREGTRVYGYLPPSSWLLVTPDRVERHGFVDAAAHRAALPSAYNSYADVRADPSYDSDTEDAQMLLRPLFFTSYLLDDFIGEDAPQAEAVVISSASSKTAGALAFLLHERGGREVLGLTSARSAAFTRGLGVYDAVCSYEEVPSLPRKRAIYVDIAGDGAVRDAVHGHYADELAHSAVVGATHHDRMAEVPASLPGPRPAFFFAPDRLAKRAGEWGREELEQRIARAWQPYAAWALGWMDVVHGRGPEALQSAYLDLLEGRIDPALAHVLTLSA